MFVQIVIADESHFLKNAQAKRTSASLPVIQVRYHTFYRYVTEAFLLIYCDMHN